MTGARDLTVQRDPGLGVSSAPMRSHALARMATTGIYLLRGVSPSVQRAARVRAAREGTTLRWVLVQALREYAAGIWTPRADDTGHEHPER